MLSTETVSKMSRSRACKAVAATSDLADLTVLATHKNYHVRQACSAKRKRLGFMHDALNVDDAKAFAEAFYPNDVRKISEALKRLGDFFKWYEKFIAQWGVDLGLVESKNTPPYPTLFEDAVAQ